MAEYSNSAIVTVAAGQNVPFTEEANTGKPCIVHREGAGLVTLRGLTNQCRAKFKVSFGANIAIPTGGTVEAITAAISINGEALNASTATVTPAAGFLQYLCFRCGGCPSWLLCHRRRKEHQHTAYSGSQQ